MNGPIPRMAVVSDKPGDFSTANAATKFNVFASLSNMPIAYMTLIDGWAHERWGAAGLLNVESAIGVLGIVVFLIIAFATSRRPAAA